MQASRLRFSPALEKRAGGLSNWVRLTSRLGPQHLSAFPPEPGTRLTQLLVQGKDSNAALPLHPHPAPVYHAGKLQALSHWPLAEIQNQTTGKKSFDRSVIVRSNGTSPFVCNKTCMGGGGVEILRPSA